MASSIDLPVDIIHTILLNLPVKSLLRFQAVCKLWNDIIADCQFAENHRKTFKNPKSRNLFFCIRKFPRKLYLSEFEKNNITYEELPEQPFGEVLCIGDGLVLLDCTTMGQEGKLCALWNPSSRKHRPFWCPYKWSNIEINVGLCRDPNMDDYKVVIIYKKYYVSFSFKNITWTKKKNFPYNTRVYPNPGLWVDGFSFWILGEQYYNIEKYIIYFDPRDDEFKKLHKPKLLEGFTTFYLTSLGGCLCLYDNTTRGNSTILRMWMMKGHVDSCSWTELRNIEIMPATSEIVRPMFFIENNVKGISLERHEDHMSWTPIETLVVSRHENEWTFPVDTYVDSLFLPTNRRKRKRSSRKTLKFTYEDHNDDDMII